MCMSCIREKMFDDIDIGDIDDIEEEEEEIECCLNCLFYKPGEDIECIRLAKKYNLNSVQIDTPYTLRCSSYVVKEN